MKGWMLWIAVAALPAAAQDSVSRFQMEALAPAVLEAHNQSRLFTRMVKSGLDFFEPTDAIFKQIPPDHQLHTERGKFAVRRVLSAYEGPQRLRESLLFYGIPAGLPAGAGFFFFTNGMGGLELYEFLKGELRAFLSGSPSLGGHWDASGLARFLFDGQSEYAVLHVPGIYRDVGRILRTPFEQVRSVRVSGPLDYVRQRAPGRPAILVGNSIGGAMVAQHLALGGYADGAILVNSAFELEAAARLLRHETLFRMAIFDSWIKSTERPGVPFWRGQDPFLKTLVAGPDNAAFLSELAEGLRRQASEHGLPPVLMIATRTPHGKVHLSGRMGKVAEFYGIPNTDGVVHPRYAANLAPDGRPLIPGALVIVINGIDHMQAIYHPLVHALVKEIGARMMRGERLQDLVIHVSGRGDRRLGRATAEDPLVLDAKDTFEVNPPERSRSAAQAGGAGYRTIRTAG